MIKIAIDVNAVSANAALMSITRAMSDRAGLHGSLAKGTQSKVQDHLLTKYVPRNKRGDFWADVRNGVTATANDGAATVTLNELGISLRFNGGEVTPGKSISSYTGKPTRALAIPSDKVRIEGGRQIRPGRAGLLAFMRTATKGGDTVGYLVEGEEKEITRGPNKGKKAIVPKTGGELLYTLRTITRHKGDKGILPKQSELLETAKMIAAQWIDSYDER